MARPALSTWIVVLSLLAAIAIWLAYLPRALQLDGTLGAPKSSAAWMIGLVLGACVLDGLVAVRALRSGRIGLLGLLWVGFRTLLSIAGFLLVTLPFYAVALVAVTREPRHDPRLDPARAHAYRATSSGWFRSMTPVGWSRTLLGASQLGETRCVVCGEPEADPIHAPEG